MLNSKPDRRTNGNRVKSGLFNSGERIISSASDNKLGTGDIGGGGCTDKSKTFSSAVASRTQQQQQPLQHKRHNTPDRHQHYPTTPNSVLATISPHQHEEENYRRVRRQCINASHAENVTGSSVTAPLNIQTLANIYMANEQHAFGASFGGDQAAVGGGGGGGGTITIPSSPFGGCSRTTPLFWAATTGPATGAAATSLPFIHQSHSHQIIKQEICSSATESAAAATSNRSIVIPSSFVNVKLEPKSPSFPGQPTVWEDQSCNPSFQEKPFRTSSLAIMDPVNNSSNCGAGQIPVGIAVARQRLHHPEGSLGPGSALKDANSGRPGGGLGTSSFVEMIPGPGGGVGPNLFLSTFPNDGGLQNQAMRTPSTIWQYPMEPILPMSLPPVGLQLVRDPTTGQYIFVPSIDPFSQAVVWPSYANVQQAQPAPIQFLGAPDYLSASTTLHQQHTTSTRLVALPNNDLKQRYLGGPPTTGITSTPVGDPSAGAPLLGVMNKIAPSTNSRILPTTLGNTIIKIEDNTGTLTNLGDHQQHDSTPHFTIGPSLNTTTDILGGNTSGLVGQGFLMPHTPILTPAPTLFDMTEKSFLANVSQQQRQFQMNLNSSFQMDSGACHIVSDASLALPSDLSSMIYSQPRMSTSQADFQQQLTATATMPSLTTLESSAMTFGGHSSLLLTPDTVIAARSTGGLLTPPSPMPAKSLPNAPLMPSLLASGMTIEPPGVRALQPPAIAASSLLAVCPKETGPVVNTVPESSDIGECCSVGAEAHPRRSSKNSPVKKLNTSVDATMQTDTPVCSDEEENTQDTSFSANKESQEDIGAGSDDTSACVGETNRDGTGLKESDERLPVVSGSDISVDPEVRQERNREVVDLSGLKLLSNSIEEFEKNITIKKETHLNTVGGTIHEENNSSTIISSEISKPVAQETLQNEVIVQPDLESRSIQHSVPSELDGLNLLCALAEQRLVEEGNGVELAVNDSNSPKENIMIEFASGESEKTPKRNGPEFANNVNHIPSPSSRNVDNLSDLELNIKKRLADLTRQCEEKRRELDKMEKINPFYRMGTYSQSYTTPSKYTMSDDEETRSSRSGLVRTPLTPTLLFGSNNVNSGSPFVSEVPKMSSDTESSKYDDGDVNSLERMSKRKGGVPKKWDDCSETETIVAKKPKNMVGYIFSSKNRNELKGTIKGSSLIKHGQLQSQYNNSTSSGSNSSENIKFEPIKVKEEIIDGADDNSQDGDGAENNPFSFIGARYKTAPGDLGDMPAIDLFKAKCNSAEERHSKHHKKNKNKKHRHKSSTGKKKRNEVFNNRCRLTEAHLDDKEKKTRVLTSMGGLFYAGVLSPIQPPDIYSVILDGQRGNRPHIMSREEVQRDAILEIVPTDPSEVPPGTRLCAYWSQQYRCLYPGTAAQPGTPDVNSKKQYISVEFDDGDSGRIAMDDIRLLFKDYPIVEYDPNPLLSLKRKRPTNSTSLSSHEAGGSVFSELNPVLTTSSAPEVIDKERRRIKKIKKHKLKRQLISMAEYEEQKQVKDSKRKNKCTEEVCTHRKHKKKRKHKRHSADKEEPIAVDDNAVSCSPSTVPQECPTQEVTNDNLTAMETEEDTETMDSYRDDPDFHAGPSNSQANTKKKETHSPDQNKSKIAAFLPARQLWDWAGQSYRRSCVKGRVKKQFFKMIQRGRETIAIGDSAVFLSTGRPDRPYIGRIVSMWKTNSCNMIVRVKWFYHPEETEGCPKLKYPGGLFESPHEDENDVQTISHKCEVLSVYDFTKKFGDDPKKFSTIYDNNDTYYQAGYYDPTALSLTMQPNIPMDEGAAKASTSKE